jgi:hypothetical protein
MIEEKAAESVRCASHGLVRPAFVCRHIFEQLKNRQFSRIGFFEPDRPGEELNGWCGECDGVLRREEEWNDVSEAHAGIKLVCSSCFVVARKAQGSQGQ